ncbi:MAG: NAD(P)/FAD-dependent oxidoreductase [Tissierellia bacterium]|jgi:predicted Rossmann fold flavoprotein|nr:NAD(P)/FAD-dependent oxidoreductase [Tissierellia bacterium]
MNISIIGGGPSGMFLSILLKRNKPDWAVRIFERNDRVGKKLLATGNGRCNYTNVKLNKTNFHSENISFPMKIIEKFDNKETMEYLKTIGIYPIIEKEGRVYPLSLQGSSVLDLLRIEMDKLGVDVVLNEKIDKVIKRGDRFLLNGSKKYESDILVIATGGLAMPSSGSDGIGYRLAKEFGHDIIDQYPTIVQLESDFYKMKSLKGVRIDTNASLYVEGEKVSTKSGDVLFTDYGLSGPAVLDLSRQAIQALKNDKKVEVGVNIVGINKEEIQSMIENRIKNLEGIEITSFFIGIIHKKLIQSVLNVIQFQLGTKLTSIYHDDKLSKAIIKTLSDFRFNITGYKGFGNAQSTIGGVDTTEINEDSLESKLVKDLYFIGEVLDVDGDCGGYNLQWAWSSAFVAGSNINNKER